MSLYATGFFPDSAANIILPLLKPTLQLLSDVDIVAEIKNLSLRIELKSPYYQTDIAFWRTFDAFDGPIIIS